MPQSVNECESSGVARRDKLLQHAVAMIESASGSDVELRLVGSLGVQYSCPVSRDLAVRNRQIKDIDLAAHQRDHEKIRVLFSELGFSENKEVFVTSEGRRSIFRHVERDVDVDVFYGALEFCHKIELGNLLGLNQFTIPPTELLLQKLQIVKIGTNDLLDIGVLLLDHDVNPEGEEGLSRQRLSALWGKDWGLCRTCRGNLDELSSALAKESAFHDEQMHRIAGQVETLLRCMEDCPKTLSWKMRNKIGDKVKWYNDVEDV